MKGTSRAKPGPTFVNHTIDTGKVICSVEYANKLLLAACCIGFFLLSLRRVYSQTRGSLWPYLALKCQRYCCGQPLQPNQATNPHQSFLDQPMAKGNSPLCGSHWISHVKVALSYMARERTSRWTIVYQPWWYSTIPAAANSKSTQDSHMHRNRLLTLLRVFLLYWSYDNCCCKRSFRIHKTNARSAEQQTLTRYIRLPKTEQTRNSTQLLKNLAMSLCLLHFPLCYNNIIIHLVRTVYDLNIH